MIKILNTRRIDTLKGKIELRNEQISGYIKEIDALNDKLTAQTEAFGTFATLANTNNPKNAIAAVQKVHQSVKLAVEREQYWTKVAALKSENEQDYREIVSILEGHIDDTETIQDK